MEQTSESEHLWLARLRFAAISFCGHLGACSTDSAMQRVQNLRCTVTVLIRIHTESSIHIKAERSRAGKRHITCPPFTAGFKRFYQFLRRFEMGHTPGHLIVVGVENKMAAGVLHADQSTHTKWRAQASLSGTLPPSLAFRHASSTLP